MECKDILIIVPHADDEINLSGGLIYSLSKKNNITVCFVTNGDYSTNAKFRIKEAIKALKILGVKKKNIIFLGYSDQSYKENNHMYIQENNWISKNDVTETYCSCGIEEWCYIKHRIHKKFNKTNVIDDLKELIIYKKTDIIICTDIDYHPDHIMTSLCFEKALGQVLKNDKSYKPIVLKGFAYENSYFGLDDFDSINAYGMKYKFENKYLVNNRYYSFDDMLKINIDEKCYSKNVLLNPVYKAIKKHYSQLLILHAKSIINSNNCFWQRRTNNLLIDADLKCSSGNAELLRDFVLCDSDYIMHGDKNKIIYNKGIWIPTSNDKEKKIIIDLKKEKFVKSIVFYHGIYKDNINEINLKLDDELRKIKFNSKIKKEIIEINQSIKKLEIILLDNNISNGFSEIEVLEDDSNIFNDNYCINDFWTNNYICLKNDIIKFNKNINIDNLKNFLLEKNNILINSKSSGYIEIGLNKVYINKQKYKFLWENKMFNFLYKIDICINKIYKKMFIK